MPAGPSWEDPTLLEGRPHPRGAGTLDSSPIEQAYGLKLAGLSPREVLSPRVRGRGGGQARHGLHGLVLPGDAPAVLNVVPGSPAAEAGLAYGQEILAVNEWRTATASDITRRIGDWRGRESVEVLATDCMVRRRTFVLAENSQKTTRILPVAKPSPVQREAFEDWTGQTFPRGEGTPVTPALRIEAVIPAPQQPAASVQWWRRPQGVRSAADPRGGRAARGRHRGARARGPEPKPFAWSRGRGAARARSCRRASRASGRTSSTTTCSWIYDGQHDPADLQRFLDRLALDPGLDFPGSRKQDAARIPAGRWCTNALGT